MGPSQKRWIVCTLLALLTLGAVAATSGPWYIASLSDALKGEEVMRPRNESGQARQLFKDGQFKEAL
ncbi:hypothetical protein, partial [Thermogutta sp.]|uniref:hypothetical protein n=1 Tax=Thermogutta sp. TaxID=1962930 RepID=UPI00321F8B00